MDIQEIRQTMRACEDKLEDIGYFKLSKRLNIAEKRIEQEIGLRWTQASELAEALDKIAFHDCDDTFYALENCQQIAADAIAKWKEANK